MFGSYLGIKKAADAKNQRGGAKYSRASSQATPSTKCQKCLKLGHWTADCKETTRVYNARPTRTQILKNPKLRTKLTESAPPMPATEQMPKSVHSPPMSLDFYHGLLTITHLHL